MKTVRSGQGIKVNSFVPCTQRRWKSRSRCPEGALGYPAEVNHQLASSTTALSHLCASGLCFCFQIPAEARHKHEELTLSLPNLQHPNKARGKARFQRSPWSLSHLFIPALPGRAPTAKKTLQRTWESKPSCAQMRRAPVGKKKKVLLAWQGRQEPDLPPSRF